MLKSLHAKDIMLEEIIATGPDVPLKKSGEKINQKQNQLYASG
jgi:hypothetical protein